MRLLLVLLATALSTSAQTTAFGAKATPGAPKGITKVVEEEVDNSVVITAFREAPSPATKLSRTFQLSKLNKVGFTETTKELQRLFTAFTAQRIVDSSPAGSSKASGHVTAVNYALLQDLDLAKRNENCSQNG